MFTHPGTKLLFMGNDLGQYTEWNFTWQLEWDLLKFEPHKGLNETVKKLNHLYITEKALYHYNFSNEGFTWVDAGDRINSILCFQRNSDVKNDVIMVVCNLNVTPHQDYKIGLYAKQEWDLIFNTDEKQFWGSGFEVRAKYKTIKKEWNGRNHCLEVDIPPLCVLVFKLLSSVEDKKVVEKKVVIKNSTKKIVAKSKK
jgi:1,4-alpha-glucan branching enzyme